eukprot:gene57777-biopygen9970
MGSLSLLGTAPRRLRGNGRPRLVWGSSACCAWPSCRRPHAAGTALATATGHGRHVWGLGVGRTMRVFYSRAAAAICAVWNVQRAVQQAQAQEMNQEMSQQIQDSGWVGCGHVRLSTAPPTVRARIDICGESCCHVLVQMRGMATCDSTWEEGCQLCRAPTNCQGHTPPAGFSSSSTIAARGAVGSGSGGAPVPPPRRHVFRITEQRLSGGGLGRVPDTRFSPSNCLS